MDTLSQSIAAIFVALGDAGGTLTHAKKILAQSLQDGAVSDPIARCIIEACASADEGLSHGVPQAQ